jgi:hypothetical protein
MRVFPPGVAFAHPGYAIIALYFVFIAAVCFAICLSKSDSSPAT